ncbi:MAG: heavy metal translocating P-type ATPase [Thermoplasmata archaeon]|nr:heavy metal translocating P-type ATPase [Thermoplasmata archaeon]
MTTRQTTLRIKGMHCATCSRSVAEALRAVEGVARVDVNLATEKAVVEYDPERAAPTLLDKAVTDSGYEVVRDEITMTVSGMHCATCSTTVQEALVGLPGVTAARVNFALGKASVEYDPEMVGPDELRRAVDGAGYKVLEVQGVLAERLARQEELRDGRRTLVLAAAFGIPVALLSMLYSLLPDGAVAVQDRNYLLLVLSVPVQFIAGLRYYRGSYRAVLNRRPNMDVLVVLGTTAAWAYSLLVTVAPGTMGTSDVYFDTSAMIITLVLAGKYLELRSRGSASEAIIKLMDLQPPKASVVRGGEEVEIPADELAEGDIIVLRAGDRVPVDGVVVSGESSIDESLVTGESIPKEKAAGSDVTGGTVNLTGMLRVRATRVGRDTTLAQIIRLVEEAQSTKAPIERVADTVAAYFVPAVMAVASTSLLFWYFVGSTMWDVGDPLSFSLTAFVAVLVIACPCALGLATPTAIVVGTGRGAQLGILIRNAEALETAHSLTTVAFDKTGTLTVGEPRMVRIELEDAISEEELLFLAGSAERGSEHVLSRAVTAAASDAGVELSEPRSSRVHPGEGVISEVGEQTVAVGNRRMAERLGVPIDSVVGRMEAMEAEGMTVVVSLAGRRILGLMGIADTIRPSAAEVVSGLRGLGLRVVMITGDNERTARAIAEMAGIDDYMAEVMPAGKAQAIRDIQSRGEVVAMVGDGINDAPALAQADIGIALGSGTDIALESGDIVLVRGDLRGVTTAVRLSRMTFRKIRQNLFWALFYNTASLPIAAGLLYPWTHWLLSPMVAAAAMAFSSVSVVANASLLRRFQP